MGLLIIYFKVVCFILVLSLAKAWDNDDLEVFDVVEEVNSNFYEFLGLSQDASQAAIKSAYKQLTLKLHPDKNDADDAEIQFRNLVSIYNILKDVGKREKYNEVLKNGLPNWRSAVYYYRHVRKMGLVEMAIILFIIVTISQYVVGWAAYAEKRYTAEQILGSKLKRKKKDGVGTDLLQILEQLPTPSVKDTLPFQIPRLIWAAVTGIPHAILATKRHFEEKREEQLRQKKWEEEEKGRAEREAAELEAIRAERAANPRKRRGFVPPEGKGMDDHYKGTATHHNSSEPIKVLLLPQPFHLIPYPNAYLVKRLRPRWRSKEPARPVISGGLWTDEDLVELVKLVKRYPGGSAERWVRIAEAMNRSVPEVTHMAAKLKNTCFKLPEQDPEPPPELPKKSKTRGGKLGEAGDEAAAVWSQAQQKALEAALARFPKGGASDRWEKIANCVPDKTKEDCMMRCKYLSDMLKKQKLKEQELANEAEANDREIHADTPQPITPTNQPTAKEEP